MDRSGVMARGVGKQVCAPECALASDLFDKFCSATTLKQMLGYHRQLCDVIHLRPTYFPQFYQKLKQYVDSWRAKALWKKFDARAGHKCYAKGKACSNTRVLIIGGGPCGLRTAIEAQLLGAKVVVVEKRDRLSRNNVLHLWPFVIEDLRALGAKKFFGKFCAGAIDHISIRQLQCILTKVALLLGVEIHTEVSFVKLLAPPSKEESQERIGWRGLFCPADHPVSQYEFDVLIGADGRRNTLEGFKRKEFRGRLAIAITANFINKRTEAEARVEEISGVAFIFNQKFFKDLYEETGIDLENIVYYKDDTHYFVMTAKKQSLLDKGVIINDIADTSKLLARENVAVDALKSYAREAADFSTQYQMPDLEFAVNHYGNADVTMFDFTSMYAAENASKVIERHGHRLMMTLVGDSLLEPFWPTGSGCARGFLSSLDACWAIRGWGSGTLNPLEVLAERESIYRLLGQTTPENLQRDNKSYTLDPSTRYPNLNRSSLLPMQVTTLFDTDDANSVQLMSSTPALVPSTHELHKKRRRNDSQVHPDTLLQWLKRQIIQHEELKIDNVTSSFKDGLVLCAIIHRYRPDLLDFQSLKKGEIAQNNQMAFEILERELGIPPVMTGLEMEMCETPDFLTMLSYLSQIYDTFRGEIPHIKHPKLDLTEIKKVERPMQIRVMPLRDNNALASRINAIHAPTTVQQRLFSGRHRRHVETSILFTSPNVPERKTRKRRSVDKVGASLDRDVKMPGGSGRGEKDEEFSGRIKDFEDKLREQAPQEKKPKDLLRAIGKIETTDWNVKEIEKKIIENKMGKAVSKEKERVPKWSREQFLARQTKIEKRGLDRQDSEDNKYATIDKTLKQLDQKLKEGNIREQGQNKVSAITEQFAKLPEPESKPVQRSNSRIIVPVAGGSENCHFCSKRVYLMERLSAEGRFFHRGCFRCQYCSTSLRLGSYLFDKDGKYGHKFYCSQHFGMQGQMKGHKKVRKSTGKSIRNGAKSPEKIPKDPDVAVSVDMYDRVQTPERIKFSNIKSDHEDSLSQMDEDEWTDRNFGASTAEIGSSDDEDDSSDSSGSESDDDEAYEEALEEPLTKEATQRLVDRWTKRYSKDCEGEDDSGSPEDYDTGSDQSYENSSDDDESDTATEGEEEIRARELRKQEVRVEPPVVQHTDTGSDTEIASDEDISSSEKENSATEITTDSEFDHDDVTPTDIRDIPSILLNDSNVTKYRGSYQAWKKVQVISGELQRPINSKKTGNIELKMTQLPFAPAKNEPSPDITNVRPSPLVNPRKGDYMLNRTQSTGGIAAKISLELKKRYLLDTSSLVGNIQRSGSTTALDSKLKSFHSNISEHQKLLNPAPEISPSMQAFLQGTSKIHTPLSPSITPKSPIFCLENKFDQFLKEASKKEDTSKEKPKTGLQSAEMVDLTLSSNEKFATQPDITKDVLSDLIEEKYDLPKLVEKQVQDVTYANDTEGRPRSPVHETSIIVPEISWKDVNKLGKKNETDIDTDSLSSENSDVNEQKSVNNKVYSEIPRVEVHDTSGTLLQDDDIVMDSLCIISEAPIKQDAETVSSTKKPMPIISDVPKSILSDRKTLNQPKILPVLANGFDAKKCHTENKGIKPESKEETKSDNQNSSGRSTPISISDPVCNDGTGAALTETELSDWARDGTVSDNLDDVEFDINPKFGNIRSHKKPKNVMKKSNARIALGEDFEDNGHVCGKDKYANKIPSGQNGIPIADFDSIEFMDIGSEVSSDDIVVQTTNTGILKNRGYVQFVNEEEHKVAIQTIPNNNHVIEAVNYDIPTGDQNTGYCVFGNEDENSVGNFANKVTESKVTDLQEPKPNLICDNEDDSLLNIEPGTTTEENTCSDSTVKNLNKSIDSDLPEEKSNLVIENITEDTENKNEDNSLTTPTVEEQNGVEYDEHVKRLQLKYAEFGFVRDSIDIRKSKRKSKSQSPPSQSEHSEIKALLKDTVSPTFSSPITSRKLDEINKERTKQKDLIHDLVMDRVKTQRRSMDKRRKLRDSFSPSCSPVRTNFDLSKSATVGSAFADNNNSKNLTDAHKANKEKLYIPLQKSPTVTGLPEIPPKGKENALSDDRIHTLTTSQSLDVDVITPKKDLNPRTLFRPLSINEGYVGRSMLLKESTLLPDTPLTNPEAFSLPDIHQIVTTEEFKTPIAPPRTKHDDAKRTAEKLKQDAKARARLMSDEDLGLSPEDKLNIHRQKLLKSSSKKSSVEDCIQDSIESLVLNTEKRNAILFNDTLGEKKQTQITDRLKRDGELQNSFSSTDISNKLSIFTDACSVAFDSRNRTKSVSEISKSFNASKSVDEEKLKKSMSGNIIHRTDSQKRQQQFYQSDPNLLTDSGKKEKKSKDRERRKSIIKSVADFFQKKKDTTVKSPNTSASVKDRFARFRISPKSKEKSKERISELQVPRKSLSENSLRDGGDVSPTPPPVPPPPLNYIANTRDDSGSDGESEWKKLNNSTDTLDKSTIDGSTTSIGGRRISRSMRKASRQAQIKRHRQAQEIQRKLEETEVKTRELEERGVVIEKVFRGEVTSDTTDEAELLKEWFKLMQDRTELRRYEKELLLRAQELEYEDRHARLQQELRERLTGDDESKSQEDVAAEGAILTEMLEIVAKRDSLIALLEEDRQRYHEEDRDFEAQMLAKGLMLTPIKK